MKRVLVCSLAVMILMASCFTAFAADAPDYVTTTTYVTEGDVTYLEVNTAVAGATKGTMLTYIAYKDSIADGNIVYIDQQTADSTGNLNFNYVTDKDNLTGVTVKFGTSDEEVGVIDGDIASRKVFVQLGEDRETIYMPTTADTTVYPTSLTIPVGKKFTSATCGGEVVSDVVVIDESTNKVSIKDNGFEANDVITIEVEDLIVAVDPEVNNTIANTFRRATTIDGVPTEAERLTVFAKAITDVEVTDENGAEWGGIIISKTANTDDDLVIGGTGVEKFKAVYRGEEGEFAVQLINASGVDELTTNTIYARAYAINSKGKIAYSEIKTLVPSVADEQ